MTREFAGSGRGWWKSASSAGRRLRSCCAGIFRIRLLRDPEDPATWPDYAALTPHLAATAAHLASVGGVDEPDRFRGLLDRWCWFRRVLGPDHPDTLRTAGNLAAHLRALGGDAEAERLEEDIRRGR